MAFSLKDLIGPGVAVVAVAVGVWQYRLTSQSEFIKPVREAQLKLYQEASSAAAQLATLRPDAPDWIKAKEEFLRLYYGPLAMVEDFDHAAAELGRNKLPVEDAMVLFKSCLDNEKLCNELGASLPDLSLALAHSGAEERQQNTEIGRHAADRPLAEAAACVAGLQRRCAIVAGPSNLNAASELVLHWEADVMRWMATFDRYDLMLAAAVFFFVLTITLALA